MVSSSAQIGSPVIIGREFELNALGQALHAAQRGEGHCIFITGEAGVGKSRLLNELRQRAVGERFVVLQGHCFEQDVSFPYSLWINALRDLFAWSEASEIEKLLGPLASEFVKLLPELALLLAEVEPTPALDPESEKRRLFEALARFAAQLAAASPLLIVLEDLHWSDAASLDFLRAFTHRLVDRPMLLIATYRSDEQPPQLVRFLAQVNRERGADELVLAPLTRNQAAEMTRKILKLERLPGDEFLDLIMRLTEGNPFFIEEVLKTLTEAGNALGAAGMWKRQSGKDLQVPSSVYDAVQRRMERLSPETRRVLTLAATMGQRVSFELLHQVSSKAEPELLAAIKDLLAAHLLVEESADQFAFRHALTRDAVYMGSLLRERQVLHKQIGETMEQFWGATSDSHAAELAYHFDQAAVWDKALKYSQHAGEQAHKLHAPREALAHFSRALEAAEQLNIAPSWSIPSGRAHALELLGEFDRARADYELALELARRAEDRGGEWAMLIDLGFLWQSRDWVRAGDYFERAFDLARSLEEPALIAQSLNRIGHWHLHRGQAREALSCHQQALALFRELNDRRGVAHTLDLLGLDSYTLGEVVQGAAYCEEAVPILRELDDRQGLANTLANLSFRPWFDTEVMGEIDLHQLANLSETALEIARSCDYRVGEGFALNEGAVCLCRVGEYGRGSEYLRRALGIAEEIEHRELLTGVHLAWGTDLGLGLLAFAEARKHLEAARVAAQERGSVALAFVATARLVTAYILQNDLARAQGLLHEVVQADLPDVTEMTFMLRSCWAARAELELALGNPGRALHIVERLLASTANLAQYGPHAVPRLSQLRGQALVALGRIEEAVAELQGALHVAGAQGQRPTLWRLHADLGKAYRAMRRRERAELAFSSARTIIQQLANTVPDGALRENFLKQALGAIPAAPALTPRQAAMKQFGGLTERERQVAVLIAEGQSNREMARTLLITVRTVEAHITRILDKLGLKSRADIAAWTVAKGLGRPRH
ncbi:MAG TPA: BREX system ATP-binding domain-containing protein [Herpetosiphonaceae bacterium]|nr:BREX system ATP-binding domain-containing protein [Herpetosiphonaceae bacterium]